LLLFLFMNDLAIDAARRAGLSGQPGLPDILATVLARTVGRAGGIVLHALAQGL